VSGRARIPQPWIGVAPSTNGVRIALDTAVDTTVPGGDGWTIRGKGKRWRFDDPAGLRSGVRRIRVTDRSKKVPGSLSFVVEIAGATSPPTSGPVDFSIRLGDTNECATAHWGGPGASRPRCRTTGRRMTCK
jgi:hypothetical protein